MSNTTNLFRHTRGINGFTKLWLCFLLRQEINVRLRWRIFRSTVCISHSPKRWQAVSKNQCNPIKGAGSVVVSTTLSPSLVDKPCKTFLNGFSGICTATKTLFVFSAVTTIESEAMSARLKCTTKQPLKACLHKAWNSFSSVFQNSFVCTAINGNKIHLKDTRSSCTRHATSCRRLWAATKVWDLVVLAC